MENWIAIASLILTPTIVAAYAFAQRRWEHRNEERRELRQVVDDAARELNRATRGVEMLHNHYKDGAKPSDQAWVDSRAAFRSLLENTRTARDRLAIRLGMDSEVFRAYKAALEALDAYRVKLTDSVKNAVPYASGRVEAARQPLVQAHVDFLEAAQRRAGSEDERRGSPAEDSHESERRVSRRSEAVDDGKSAP